MRILILNTSDNMGGAAIAARRLVHALSESGHEVRMLVRDMTTDDPQVDAVEGNRWAKAIDRGRIFVANGFSRDKMWLTDAGFYGLKVTDNLWFKWADIVHLHWVNQGFLSLGEIGRILRSGKKVVWTMHDMWPVTGICHHAVDCVKFHSPSNEYGGGCHHCEQLCRPSGRDISYGVFRRKSQLYGATRITFVACSRWLADQARRSALTQGHTVVDIPNPIDTELFAPDGARLQTTDYRLQTANASSGSALHSTLYTLPSKDSALHSTRYTLSSKDSSLHSTLYTLHSDKKRVLFASANVSDERKGIQYLVRACERLGDLREQVELVVIGGKSGGVERMFDGWTVRVLPYATRERDMAALNASVDVFVTPSLQENLPNTIMEAMACGTACVGFDVGGIPEMIDHMANGYVARLRDTADLANGLRTALANSEAWGQAARAKVLANYSFTSVAKRYTEIYNQ